MSKVFIRNKAVDLIKMIALFTMVIDHLKFVFPSYQSQLVIVGRWAFVFFCFVVAFNASEALAKNKINTIKSYFLNLAFFSFISEIPYRLLNPNANGVWNIMPTLFLGLALVVLLDSKRYEFIRLLFFVIIIFISLFVQDHLQYGLAGALLIVFFYWYIKAQHVAAKMVFFIFSLLVALLSNLQYYGPAIKVMGVYNTLIMPLIITITLSVMAVAYLSTLNLKLRDFYVPKVGKWAYWFYPAHMLVLYAILLKF